MDGERMGQLASIVGIANLNTVEAMRIFQFAQLVANEAAQEEREACAKACENIDNPHGSISGMHEALDCADAIRMRSNVK